MSYPYGNYWKSMPPFQPKIYKKIQRNPTFTWKIYIFRADLTYIYC